jgi:hypothetical protein
MNQLNCAGLFDIIELIVKNSYDNNIGVEYRDIINFTIGLGKECYNTSKFIENDILELFMMKIIGEHADLTGFINNGKFLTHCITDPIQYINKSRTEETLYREEFYKYGKLMYLTDFDRWERRKRTINYDNPEVPNYSCNYSENEQMLYWTLNNCKHRCGLPAVRFYKYEQLVEEQWYHHGQLHRLCKPACITYENGIVIQEQYWLFGRKLIMNIPIDKK